MIIPTRYSDWIDIAIRRRRVALMAGLTIFGIVAIGTLLCSPVYVSNCQILVQDNRAELLVSPGLQENAPQSPSAVANPVNEQDLNSERELITSFNLVRLVVADLPVPASYTRTPDMTIAMIKGFARLPLTGYAAMHDIPRVTPKDAWASDIVRGLGASVIKRSNIIEVEFRSHDRRWSKDFLDRLMSKYLEFHAHLSHDPQAQQFFEEQTTLLKNRLQASEEKLRDFQLKTGIGDLGEQKRMLIARISELENEEAKAGAQVFGSQQQIAMLGSQLTATPARIEKERRSVQNMALQALKPQVAQLRAERAELLTRYQPTSERIKQIEAKLQSEESILNRENHLEVNEQTTDVNPVWTTIQTDMKQANGNAAAQKAIHDQLAKASDDANQQLAALVKNGVELQRLQRQVTSDQDAYVSYVRKTEEARASEALNSNNILNISVAQPPMVPIKPAFPNVPFNLAVGFLVALGFALGAAYLAEELDPRIYSASVMNDIVGLPILAVIRERF
jgi:polysaccharide biosynthesis protein PslE